MARSHDLHHEYHHGKHPPHSMPNHNAGNIHNTINIRNNNQTFHVKRDSRSSMGNIHGDKTSTRGVNYDWEMD